MEASKLTVTKYVRGSRMMSILRFLHNKSKENPRFLKDTTAKNLIKMYVINTEDSCSQSSALMAFSKLEKQNFLTRYQRLGTRRSDFRINYLHPALPEDMRAEAPQEEKDYISNVNARLQKKLDKGENAELDPRTATIITKPSETEEAPEQTIAKIEASPKPVCFDSPEQEPDTAACNLQPMAIKRDGNSLTLTININLNGMLQ